MNYLGFICFPFIVLYEAISLKMNYPGSLLLLQKQNMVVI